MSAIDALTFYWRPGCPFCGSLEQSLNSMGVPLDKRNIWDDPEHAATVRSIANGNETVPTVVVGETRMVNPSPTDVIAALSSEAPHLVPEGVEAPQPSKMGSAINRLLGGSNS